MIHGRGIGESFAKRGASVIALAKLGGFCKGAPTIRPGFTGGFECAVVQKSSSFTHITGGFTHCVFRFGGSFATAPCHNSAHVARTASYDRRVGDVVSGSAHRDRLPNAEDPPRRVNFVLDCPPPLDGEGLGER